MPGDNPLLAGGRLPRFERIRVAHVEPAVDAVLADLHALTDRILAAGPPYTWASLATPLADAEDRVSRVWAPVSHLHGVKDEPALREVHEACVAKLTASSSEMAQRRDLFEAWEAIAADAGLGPVEREAARQAIRDFRLGAVALEGEARDAFRERASRLARLGNQFNENVLDATEGWVRRVEDETELAGIPAASRDGFAARAARDGVTGWSIGLDFPSYHAALTHAENRDLRREVYIAHRSRASNAGPDAGRWDNTAVMTETLALRHAQARALGFEHYAALSLERKMAPSAEAVLAFLGELAERSRTKAEAEIDALRELAADDGVDTLAPWDVAFYAERQRVALYDISDEALRAYFPVERALDGLFGLIERLFGVRVAPAAPAEVWHDDVRVFELRAAGGDRLGHVYVDLYARPGKRGGAWMAGCVAHRGEGPERQRPVAFVTCNFRAPSGDAPATLTHAEVITLFHEFGHALHHLLTRVPYPPLAGIRGVPWDAVELPSQLMENWCWEADALAFISGHVDTGEPMPADRVARLRAARAHMSGYQMLRQLEFALFDLRIHLEARPDIAVVMQAVRDEVGLVPAPPEDRFAHGFGHIFGGGYAAGYYSYKWAETLSADAFSRFEEDGVLNADTGAAFRREVLERGGSVDPGEMFAAFRGRAPSVDALLRQHGIVVDTAPGA